MPPLHSPAVVRALLAAHGLRADKGFGQNFLIDGNVLAKIVAAAGLGPDDTVLEVGPGLGVLTRALAEEAGRVVAVELDERLLPVLAETVGDRGNVQVVWGDGLRFDLSQLPRGSLLVANLPYNVATPLIVRALESGRFRRLVVMVQKEVAERLAAGPGERGFGALSLVVAQFAGVRRVADVGPSAFYPPPEVTSSVVRLEVDPDAAPDPELTELIHTAFKHRRKTLQKNLLMAGYPRGRVEAALAQSGLAPTVRAEALPLATFRALLEALSPSSSGSSSDYTSSSGVV
jgi:16S rRNA (adenine1518-N6/adenine1519-N6)-dimethyltransferase